jgi:hypothetical protein
MPAPRKNRNAKKNPDRVADAFLHVRVREAEKVVWAAAAHPEPLSSWIRRNLNRAARGTEASKRLQRTPMRSVTEA